MLRPLSILLACVSLFAENMPPTDQQRLAREIYKELIETNTSYTTGQTTPAAEAVARRLKAAGFPAADIQVLGASPKKMNVVVRYEEASTSPRPSRRCRSAQFRLVCRSLCSYREGRLLLRTRNLR
jgi:hypothetical protein